MGPAAKIDSDNRVSLNLVAVGVILACLTLGGGFAGWLLSAGAAQGV